MKTKVIEFKIGNSTFGFILERNFDNWNVTLHGNIILDGFTQGQSIGFGGSSPVIELFEDQLKALVKKEVLKLKR